jgi:uncharacterized protein YigE (DUF2233 family)
VPRQRVIGCAWIALLCAILPVQAGALSHVKRKGIDYAVYRCRPAELRLFWKDSEGRRFGQFRHLQEALARQGQRLVFAMNAGIFRLDPDGYSPCGLHIENGVVLHPLNRESGAGNFYLKPNGVFFIADGKAGILETDEFATASLRPTLAVQSGPLLLRGGRMHPAFLPNSTSRLHRNGVGVAPNGDVLFAMTIFREGNAVNLHDFAAFFASLGCRNALFLDGDLSDLWTPECGSAPAGNHYAAILAITAPLKSP